MRRALRRGALALALSLGATGSLPAQQVSRDSVQAMADAAQRLLGTGMPDSLRAALPLFREAARHFRTMGDLSGEATQLHRVGNTFLTLGAADSALAYYRLALPLRRAAGDRIRLGWTLDNIGVALLQLGQPDSALASHRLARVQMAEAGDRGEEAGVMLNIANLYYAVGLRDSSLAAYAESARLAEAGGDKLTAARVRANLAALLNEMGLPDSSLAESRRAFALNADLQDAEIAMTVLQNIGTVFSDRLQGDSAFHYYRLSWEFAERGQRVGVQGQLLHNLGVLFARLAVPDSAAWYLRRALQQWTASGDTHAAAKSTNSLGILAWAGGQYDSARVILARAEQLYRTVGDPRGVAVSLVNVAQVLYKLGELDSALTTFRSGLAMAREAGDPELEANALNGIGLIHLTRGSADSALAYYRQDLAATRTLGNPHGESLTLQAMGRAYALAGHGDAAFAAFDSASVLRARSGRQAGSDLTRTSFAETGIELYEWWALALLQLGSGTPATRAYAALAASERGRAQGLLDLMQDSTAILEAGRDLAQEGRQLAAAARGPGVAVLSYLATKDTLIVWLAESAERIAVGAVALPRDSLVALIGRYRSALQVERGIAVASRGPPLERGVGAAAGAGPPADLAAASTALGRTLFPEAIRARLAGIRELIIIPQGSLALIPFAALELGGSEAGPLGARMAVRYAPSLAALAAAEGKARPGDSATAVIVGNPTMPTVALAGGPTVLEPLGGAEAEARTVARGLTVQPLLAAAATETAVRARLPGASLIHLATHGFAFSDGAMARRSFVALARDSLHDGLLTVGDLLDDPALRLSADLVVLSACQTGLGNLRQAEGTIGFQRAFLARGARSVLVSLWSVSDLATTRLMERFYAHWRSDADRPGKAEALRRAQEDVRRLPGFSHPRYWAAFQVVGAR